MRTVATLLAAALVASSAHAETPEDEYYLLGDYGVRVDLPDDWRSSAWSDAALEAEKEDRSLKLFAWGQVGQITPVEADLDVWAKAFEAQVGTLGGNNPKVVSQKVVTLQGRPTARFELDFDFGKNLEGAMSGATFAVEGRVFHVAIITAAKRGSLASQAVEMVLERAEVRKPAVEVQPGQVVEASGVSVALPDGWRAPIGAELGMVASQARKLGVENLEPCWTALRHHAGADPDVLFTCPGGTLLGVVDAYSFDGVAAALKPQLLGELPTDPPRQVVGADGRVGIVYAASGEGSTLRVGVMPYGQGVAITRVFGASHQEADFDAAVDHVLSAAAYTGEHPTGTADTVSYYLTYRPTSPLVLGPAALLLALLGGGVFLATRGRKNKYADLT